jgi:hypothetical protein
MRTSAIRHRRREGGWGLLPTIVLIGVLTLLGTSVLQTVASDAAASGAQRRSENLLNVAEAGVSYGMERLRGAPFNFETGADVNEALKDANAPGISDASCNTSACPLQNWHELTLGAPGVSFAGGTFRVAVRDDIGSGSDSNNRILMRSLATDSRGTQRLVEVMVELQSN